jgi:hypothetical protein
MLMQLAPASANFLDGMKNMVESHVLERNKYWSKFPTLDTNQPSEIEGVALGRLSQTKSPEINSPSVVPQCESRQVEVIIIDPSTGNNRTLCISSKEDYLKVRSYIVSSPVMYQGGSNTTNSQKKHDYFKNQLKLESGVELSVTASELSKQNFDNEIDNNLEKVEVNFSVEDSSLSGNYSEIPGNQVAPFSLYSSSVELKFQIITMIDMVKMTCQYKVRLLMSMLEVNNTGTKVLL